MRASKLVVSTSMLKCVLFIASCKLCITEIYDNYGEIRVMLKWKSQSSAKIT